MYVFLFFQYTTNQATSQYPRWKNSATQLHLSIKTQLKFFPTCDMIHGAKKPNCAKWLFSVVTKQRCHPERATASRRIYALYLPEISRKCVDPSTPLRSAQDDIPVVRCIIRPLNNHLQAWGEVFALQKWSCFAVKLCRWHSEVSPSAKWKI